MGGSDVETSAVGCKSEVMGIVQRQGFSHLSCRWKQQCYGSLYG